MRTLDRDMIGDFDFTALDDPGYKEDAVREDLVALLLRALGTYPLAGSACREAKHLFIRS